MAADRLAADSTAPRRSGLSTSLVALATSLRRAATSSDEAAVIRVALPALLVAGALLRLLLLPIDAFQPDTLTLAAWADRLASTSFADFYAAPGFVAAPPGLLWLLWPLGEVAGAFSLLDGDGFALVIKFVAALADLALAGLLFLLGRRLAGATGGLIAAALYLFNPAVLFLTAIWGQFDAIGLLLLVAAWVLLLPRPEVGLPLLAVAVLVNPLLLPAALLLALATLLQIAAPLTNSPGWSTFARAFARERATARVGLGLLLAVAVTLLLALPFDTGPAGLWGRWSLWERLTAGRDAYPYASLNALNFWVTPLTGSANWRPDATAGLFGTSLHAWGNLLFALAFIAIALQVGRAILRDRTAAMPGGTMLAWGVGAVLLAGFVLPTRVHERDLLPAIAAGPLLVALVPRARWARWTYALLSTAFLANLAWVYSLAEPFPAIRLLETDGFHALVGLLTLALFLALMMAGGIATTGSVSAERPISLPARLPSLPLARLPVSPSRFAVSLPAQAAWLRHRYALPGLLVVAALLLYLIRLGDPPGYSFDEVYHAYTAAQYVEGNTDAYVWWTVVPEENKPNPSVGYEWTHPPLGKWLIAGGIAVLGDEPAGWRLASALFGAGGIVLAFFLGLRLTGSRLIGALAAGLLLVDGLYFVQSRTGMVDIFVLVFTLGALLATHATLTAPAGTARQPMVLTGLCLGLALATKWNAAYAAGLIGLLFVGQAGWCWWQSAPSKARTTTRSARVEAGAVAARNRAIFREYLVWLPLALGVIPAAIYLLSYTPFFMAGYSWDQFVELQRQMWHYHSNLTATHSYQSEWWQWPLAAKPVWYHVTWGETTRAFTYANVNPILAWAMVPAVLVVCWLWWRERRWVPLLILGVGFFGQWLPWALSPRISFAYHFLPAVPWGALAIATVLVVLGRRAPVPRRVAAVYVVAVVLAFAFFYPIYSGVPLTPDRLELRYWFDSWR